MTPLAAEEEGSLRIPIELGTQGDETLYRLRAPGCEDLHRVGGGQTRPDGEGVSGVRLRGVVM
jgi:hypothetical protein